MAKYYGKSLRGALPRNPPIGPLTGLQAMRRARSWSPMVAQDGVAGFGRRILATQGLRGQTEWLSIAGTTAPNLNTKRTTAEMRCVVTPGHEIGVVALVLPSGGVHTGGGGNGDFAGGYLEVEITWTYADTSTDTTTHQITPPPSNESGFAEPTGAGALWTSVRVLRADGIRPPIGTSPADVHRLTLSPISATITISNYGAPRVIDACVYEQPRWVAHEADDPEDTWVSHAAEAGGGASPEYPLQRRSETGPDGDPRHGTWQLLSSHHAQRARLGPIIASWSAYDEQTNTVTQTDPTGITVSATSFTNLFSGDTAYDPDCPGWSMSCGAYARRYTTNDDRLILRGANGVAPIRVHVYQSKSEYEGDVRFQTAPYSWIEFAVDNDGWHTSHVEYLRVGTGPEDPVIGQIFAKKDGGSGNGGIQYVAVEVVHDV